MQIIGSIGGGFMTWPIIYSNIEMNEEKKFPSEERLTLHPITVSTKCVAVAV